jgi:HK97 family phage major capsid protein
MTIEELLAKISSQLDALAEKEETDGLSEEEREQKANLEAERKKLEEQTQEPEVDKLRRELSERTRRDAARAVAEEMFTKLAEKQAQDEEDFKRTVREEFSRMMGGDVTTAVETVVKGMRAPSRYASSIASADVVENLANGEGVKTVENVKVGEARGAKAEAKDILESKNLGRFFGIIARARQGEMFLSDGEKEFLRQGLQRKAMAEMTDSAGGYLVPIEWMDDILGLLRAQSIVRRANPREIPFGKLMNQTSISSGASASYTGENLRIAPSEMTFAEAPLLTPKNLTALVPVSNYLLADAPNADGIIRDDLVEVIALREDIEFLRGTGAGGAPLGLRNKVGVTLDPLTVPANGFQPTLADLRRIRATFRNQNAGAVRLAWFFHPGFLTYLETLTDGDGRFLVDANLLQEDAGGLNGTFDGVPFYTSTQIPANLTQGASTNATDLMIVNLAETIIGMNQDLEVQVSSEASWSSDGTNWNSAFQQNQTLFRAVVRHDIAHRRPAQIIVQTGVLV